MRVNPKDSLADIFKTICEQKNVDPYKHELRHPTKPDEALNMASPLEVYAIKDIYVVPLAGELVVNLKFLVSKFGHRNRNGLRSQYSNV